jgi:hypothetical protein
MAMTMAEASAAMREGMRETVKRVYRRTRVAALAASGEPVSMSQIP